jgi:hypothetical protein
MPHVPWTAVVCELITALCFGCLGLFLPLSNWVRWPDILTGWHFAVVVIGPSMVALGLVRRRPEALKVAVALAAHIGLPNLLSLSQMLGQIPSAADGPAGAFSYVGWGIGLVGQIAQVMVVVSCLGRLGAIPGR